MWGSFVIEGSSINFFQSNLQNLIELNKHIKRVKISKAVK